MFDPTGYENVLYAVIFVPIAIVLFICLFVAMLVVLNRKRFVFNVLQQHTGRRILCIRNKISLRNWINLTKLNHDRPTQTVQKKRQKKTILHITHNRRWLNIFDFFSSRETNVWFGHIRIHVQSQTQTNTECQIKFHDWRSWFYI